MRLSIITVCRNSVATIRDAIASVLSQQGVDVEYLIIDGASTDGTLDIIREFEKDTYAHTFKYLSEPDNGMYDALNKGIRLATGDVIGIVNSDDMLDGPDVLSRIANAFDPSIDCLFANVRFIAPLSTTNDATTRVCFARWWRPWMLQWGYMPPHPGIFIRRRCFESWGGYIGDKKAYRIAADYELLIRFFRVHRMSYRYIKLCTHAMRSGGMSTVDVEARRCLNAEIIKGNKCNGYFCCWPMLLPKYAIKIWELILPRLRRGRNDKV